MKLKTKLLILLSGVSSLVLVGCSKKQAAPEATAPALNTNTAEAAPAEPPAVAAPLTSVPSSSADVSSKLTEAQKAIKNKDLETAAAGLVAIQFSNAKMTEQQGFDQINRMRELSKMIAEGGNDPRAKRAAELLRQAQRTRTGR